MKSSVFRAFTRHSVVLALSMVFAFSCGNKGDTYGSGNPLGEGPAPVFIGQVDIQGADLSEASSYVILAEDLISNTGTSAITGNIAISPTTYAAITGFALTPIVPAAGTVFATSNLIDGKVYAADYSAPTPSNLTNAIGSMQTAYTDAAGRKNPDSTELASGNLGGLTIPPGLHKWGTAVGMTSDVYLSGTANDTWIFQIAGGLTMAAGVRVILLGGAQAKNIFWQVADVVAFSSTSHFEGILLAKTDVTFVNGATLSGRIFAQRNVTLDSNVITQPE